jgi:hypothetical protein
VGEKTFTASDLPAPDSPEMTCVRTVIVRTLHRVLVQMWLGQPHSRIHRQQHAVRSRVRLNRQATQKRTIDWFVLCSTAPMKACYAEQGRTQIAMSTEAWATSVTNPVPVGMWKGVLSPRADVVSPAPVQMCPGPGADVEGCFQSRSGCPIP